MTTINLTVVVKEDLTVEEIKLTGHFMSACLSGNNTGQMIGMNDWPDVTPVNSYVIVAGDKYNTF